MARYPAAVFAAVLLAIAGPSAVARADGDPASDFLLSQSTFLSPFDGHVSATESGQIVQMLTQAQRQGLALKVAVIVTPYDLGSVPILFRKPQTYAKFLGEEDFYYWKDELLVVMPNGYGIYKATGVPAADKAAIDALPSPGTGNGTALVVDAEHAVRVLAARHGIALALAPGGSSGSSATRERIEIGVGVLIAALIGVALRVGWRRRVAR